MELYRPGLTLDRLRHDEASIRAAARRLTAAGRSTVYLGSTFVPSEGTVFAVFEAGDVAWVIDVSRLAGVPVDRIVDVVDGRGSDPDPGGRRARRAPVAVGPGRDALPVDQKEDPC